MLDKCKSLKAGNTKKKAALLGQLLFNFKVQLKLKSLIYYIHNEVIVELFGAT